MSTMPSPSQDLINELLAAVNTMAAKIVTLEERIETLEKNTSSIGAKSMANAVRKLNNK